jgi:hypothetical protein
MARNVKGELQGVLGPIFSEWSKHAIRADPSAATAKSSFWTQAFGAVSDLAGFIFHLPENLLTVFVGFLVVLVLLALMVFLFMQVISGFGLAFLTMAIGPLCLAFGAHERTQDIALSFMKLYFVNVVLFLPLLVLAFKIGGFLMTSFVSYRFDLDDYVFKVLADPASANFLISSDMLFNAFATLFGPVAGIAFILKAPDVVKGLFR